MSVQFVSGKPGGGKSMFSVMMIIDELRLSERRIVTNVALKVPELCHYLHKKFGSTFNAHERITLLEEKDVFNFWLHRGLQRIDVNGESLVGLIKVTGRREIAFQEGERKGQKVTVPDFISLGQSLGTVFYVIDEVHIFFGARQWATNGTDGFYYLSQHRKFGDDVVCVTQHIGNVDKQFRSVAQDYTYLRNFYKERVGMFGSLSAFGRKTYSEPYTGGGGQLCMESKRFKIDVEGVCSCYDTAAGAGIVGRTGADTKERRKGIPLKYGIALALVLIIGIPYMMVRGASALPRFFFKSFKTAGTAAASASNQAHAVQTNRIKALVGANLPIQTNQAASMVVSDVYMAGYAKMPDGQIEVFLTDGRQYTSRDPAVQSIAEHGCKIDGHFYARTVHVPYQQADGFTTFSTVANGNEFKGGDGEIPSTVRRRVEELR